MRFLSHDPFARTSLVRRKAVRVMNTSYYGLSDTCAFCGAAPRYEYGTERDDRPGQVAWHARAFCSVACFRAWVA